MVCRRSGAELVRPAFGALLSRRLSGPKRLREPATCLRGLAWSCRLVETAIGIRAAEAMARVSGAVGRSGSIDFQSRPGDSRGDGSGTAPPFGRSWSSFRASYGRPLSSEVLAFVSSFEIDPVMRLERCSDDESDSYPWVGYQRFIDPSRELPRSRVVDQSFRSAVVGVTRILPIVARIASSNRSRFMSAALSVF